MISGVYHPVSSVPVRFYRSILSLCGESLEIHITFIGYIYIERPSRILFCGSNLPGIHLYTYSRIQFSMVLGARASWDLAVWLRRICLIALSLSLSRMWCIILTLLLCFLPISLINFRFIYCIAWYVLVIIAVSYILACNALDVCDFASDSSYSVWLSLLRAILYSPLQDGFIESLLSFVSLVRFSSGLYIY